ncbi:hypothetical protein A6A08_24985 [Nocardiopsis sp. TSRI0078]|uniref:sensor histidine kinase n=1 Tax=unclassified Nocardiopsis TaxID=2649073 RepID=UPI000968DAA8|nr:hypothetical protein A6A08_24985 [Nocardiopsis sp. TSRI0078]
MPIDLEYDLTGTLSPTVETAAYFVVAEAVTNAVKHAGTERIGVRVEGTDEEGTESVVVRVGGADPAGGGLAGLASRVEALDGRLSVDSPVGGPTTVRAQLPCG